MAAPRLQFTKARLEDLSPAPPGGRDRYFDLGEKGLTVRVTPKGEKAFYYYAKSRGRVHQRKLGAFPDMSIEQARRATIAARVAAAAGEDPTRGRAGAGMTLGDLFRWWMEHHAKPRRKTWEQDEARWQRYLAEYDRRPLSWLTKDEARRIHAAIEKQVGAATANRSMEMLRSAWNRAQKYDVVTGDNPMTGIDWFKETSRERRLMPAEVGRFFAALEAYHAQNPALCDYVLLSLYTGARRGNVLAMRWDDLELVDGLWRIPLTKNGQSQTIPLLAPELAILARRRTERRGPWVFPGHPRGQGAGHIVEPKGGWQTLLTMAGIEGLRLHDLRRSLASFMADAGVSTKTIGKTLGHQSATATAVYERLSLGPVRDAKAKALHLMGAPAAITPRKKRQAAVRKAASG